MGSRMVRGMGRRRGRVVQFLDKVVDEPVVFLGVARCGAEQLLDKAADVPVVVPQLLSWWSMTLLCRSSLGFVQFLDMVVDMPVVVQPLRQGGRCPCCAGLEVSRRAENCGVPQLQFLDKVVMPLL